jgi:hypothetical protein
MTLIATEVSEYGIVMVADSAVTVREPGEPVVPGPLYEKLHPIPPLHGCLSMWGAAAIDGKQTDEWIAEFLAAQVYCDSLAELVTRLAETLGALGISVPLGFHVAGYVENEAEPLLFHVRNCNIRADGGYTVGEFVTGQEFPRPDDRNPARILSIKDLDGGMWLWNGLFQTYALLEKALRPILDPVAGVLEAPMPPVDLGKRALYVVGLVRFVMVLHACAGRTGSIREPLRSAVIAPTGKVTRLVQDEMRPPG